MKNLIDFKKQKGLVPVIIQDDKTNEILMLAYMNREAWKKTVETKYIYFWSRSRNKLWLKGKNSGNKLLVVNAFLDCDNDTILIKVKFNGDSVCHLEKNKSCFFRKII